MPPIKKKNHHAVALGRLGGKVLSDAKRRQLIAAAKKPRPSRRKVAEK